MPLRPALIPAAAKMAQTYYKRYTIFKIPKEEDIDAVLKQYDVLRATAVKVSNPTAAPPASFQPSKDFGLRVPLCMPLTWHTSSG